MSGITRRGVFGSLPALAGCAPRHEHEKDVITLRVADGFPATHFAVELVIRPFMAECEKAAGGRLKFEYFPSAQLGKLGDMLRLTRWGVTDVGFIIPSFQSGKMPLSSILELPGAMGGDLNRGVRIFKRLMHEGGFLREREYKPNGVRPLVVQAPPSYQLHLSTRRPVDSLSDLKGLKIRTAGAALDAVVRSLDAVSVRMSTGELYESLSRGTIDGLLVAYLSAVAYHFPPLLKRMTIDQDFGTIVGAYSISERTWLILPPDIQSILVEVGDRVSQKAAAIMQERDKQARDRMLGAGVLPLVFEEDEEKRLQEVFRNVRQDWAASMDRLGKSGSEALAALNAALAAEA